MPDATTEANKDTGRAAIFGAISTIVTYVINQIWPDLPGEVLAAILALLFAALVWLDSWMHNNNKVKSNGLVGF